MGTTIHKNLTELCSHTVTQPLNIRVVATDPLTDTDLMEFHAGELTPGMTVTWEYPPDGIDVTVSG